MNLAAYLGIAGLTDVGYQFYNVDESANGPRLIAGILDAGDGWYSVADAVLPSGAASVRWNSFANAQLLSREYFAPPPVINTAQIADAVLTRDWTAVAGEANESLLQAARSIRNKWVIDEAGILTVYKEDGTTIAWQRSVLPEPTALPIVGMT